MVKHENGAIIIEIDRFAGDSIQEKQEATFAGNIKGIGIPIRIALNYDQKQKHHDMYCYFSLLKSKTDYSEEIKKNIKKIYRYSKYAHYTHLIPMSIRETKYTDMDFLGPAIYNMKFGIDSHKFPATATRGETMEFFPCYDEVLPMMLDHFKYPGFYITLLPETAFLNIKGIKKSYQRIPLQHVHGNCRDGAGHPYIHIVDDAERRVMHFKQIEWTKLYFE